MSAKGDGPADVDRSTEHRGSSVGTPGLSALDEEREASLADEGGASGAVVESQDGPTRKRLQSDLAVGHLQSRGRARRRPSLWVMAGALAAGALGVMAMRRRK
jgi:hypothetical protein